MRTVKPVLLIALCISLTGCKKIAGVQTTSGEGAVVAAYVVQHLTATCGNGEWVFFPSAKQWAPADEIKEEFYFESPDSNESFLGISEKIHIITKAKAYSWDHGRVLAEIYKQGSNWYIQTDQGALDVGQLQPLQCEDYLRPIQKKQTGSFVRILINVVQGAFFLFIVVVIVGHSFSNRSKRRGAVPKADK